MPTKIKQLLRVCRTCEREFKPSSRHKDCPRCRLEKRKTPCVDCGKLVRREHLRCNGCNNTVERNCNWKGGRVRHHANYIMIRIPDHPRAPNNNGYVFEHILVMEDTLDRYLAKGETVHHKNGVRDDNRTENLELWTKPQPTGIRAKDAVMWAQEVLGLYAPEFLNDCNSVSSDDGISTRVRTPPPPPEQIKY